MNPRKAEWPEAEYIVGNPPFIGARHIRPALGAGYVDSLRLAYQELPDNCDLVMYWWAKAASAVSSGVAAQAGLITTKAITQAFSRPIVEKALHDCSIVFAIPNHPWVDQTGSADVRIAMTALRRGSHVGVLLNVLEERPGDEAPDVLLTQVQGLINADLTTGTYRRDVSSLVSNERLCSVGFKVGGKGFVIAEAETAGLKDRFVRPLLSAREIEQKTRGLHVLDFTGLDESTLCSEDPTAYQLGLSRIRPERLQNNRKAYRERWWIWGEIRPTFRLASAGLSMCWFGVNVTARVER